MIHSQYLYCQNRACQYSEMRYRESSNWSLCWPPSNLIPDLLAVCSNSVILCCGCNFYLVNLNSQVVWLKRLTIMRLNHNTAKSSFISPTLYSFNVANVVRMFFFSVSYNRFKASTHWNIIKNQLPPLSITSFVVAITTYGAWIPFPMRDWGCTDRARVKLRITHISICEVEKSLGAFRIINLFLSLRHKPQKKVPSIILSCLNYPYIILDSPIAHSPTAVCRDWTIANPCQQ